jgi:hypothetical protein
LLHIASTRMCNDNNATMEQLALFNPLDEFDVANAKWMPTCVLASRGGRGGGRREGDMGE